MGEGRTIKHLQGRGWIYRRKKKKMDLNKLPSCTATSFPGQRALRRLRRLREHHRVCEQRHEEQLATESEIEHEKILLLTQVRHI